MNEPRTENLEQTLDVPTRPPEDPAPATSDTCNVPGTVVEEPGAKQMPSPHPGEFPRIYVTGYEVEGELSVTAIVPPPKNAANTPILT